MKPAFGYSLDDYDLENQNEKHYQPNGTLLNNFNILDTSSLNKIESDYAELRFKELISLQKEFEFSVSYYTSIHKHIFQDVYPWAGEVRAIDTMKGDSLFTPHQKIIEDLDKSLKKLENNLKKSNSKSNIAEGLGVFLGEVNRIHPFPEGNGRTQRLFISNVIHKEYSIDWGTISSERMKLASIEAHENNLLPMIKIIENSLREKKTDINHSKLVKNIEIDNNSYLNYKNKANSYIQGTITDLSNKYIVLKNIENNYVVLNRKEFENLIPSMKIGNKIDIPPIGLNTKDSIAIEAYRKVIQEKFKDHPEKMTEKLEALNSKIPDIVEGKIKLPEPPIIKKHSDIDIEVNHNQSQKDKER